MVTKDRKIRVFISSTFKDMHNEREEMVKKVFPQLKKLCEQRMVAWEEVDLRWGITDEQKAEGLVLPICLEEISRCTIFIGILGSYYGWIPFQYPEDNPYKNQFGWAPSLDLSVTDLEIRYALSRDELVSNTFFYFRKPNADSLLHIDGYNNASNSSHETMLRTEKLEKLKDFIRSKAVTIHENYSNLEEFSNLLLHDISTKIDQIYPIQKLPNLLVVEAEKHTAFAVSHSQIFHGRISELKQLNDHIDLDGPPLIIQGPSGIGKSALLAYWSLQFEERNPHIFQIRHFIGAGSQGAKASEILQRIIEELNQQFHFQFNISSEDYHGLCSSFVRILHLVAKIQKIIIIIDGLDHLIEDEPGGNLRWLPEKLPSNIRLILSTTQIDKLDTPDTLNRINWSRIELSPFEEKDRTYLVQKYLNRYGKHLNTKYVNQIISHQSTANPLFLQTLLEEIRLISDHASLPLKIAHYLSADTPEALFDLVLQRYERDYNSFQNNFTKNVLILLWVSRRGIKESELLDLLGSDGVPFPQVYLSIFLFASGNGLINRSGLISFSHNAIRSAVEKRYYLYRISVKSRIQRKLIKYFTQQELSVRKIEELPWQIYMLKDWKKLSKLLGNLHFLSHAVKKNRYEIRFYWSQIIKQGNIDILSTYSPILKNPHLYEEHIENVHLLLVAAGFRKRAENLEKFMIEQAKLKNDDLRLADLLNQAGIFAKYDGNINLAWDYFIQSQAINLRIGNKKGLVTNFSGQVLILLRFNKIEDALFLSKWQEQLSRELDEPVLIAAALAHQSLIYRKKGQWAKSVKLNEEQLSLAQNIGDLELQANALINLAQVELHNMIGDRTFESIPLGQQITSLWRLNQLTAEAHQLAVKSLSVGLARQIEEFWESFRPSLKKCPREWIETGVKYFRLGQYDHALDLFKMAEDVAQSFGDEEVIGISIGEQALVHLQQGNYERSLSLLKIEEGICRKLNDKKGLQFCIGNQVAATIEINAYEDAHQLLGQHETLCIELNDLQGLCRCYANMAKVAFHYGKNKIGLDLLKRQEQIARKIEDREGIVFSLLLQAEHYVESNYFSEEIRSIILEAHAIAESEGWKPLQDSAEAMLDRFR